MVRVTAAIQFLQSGLLLNVFSDYADALKHQYGWSRTTLSAAFAMTRVESGLLGPLQGWMVDRFGPRRVIRVGAVVFGLGFIALSRIEGLTGFFAFYFVVSVGASLCGFLTLTTVLVNWFRARRATALALAQAGFAAGGLLVPAVAWWISRFGWRSAALVTGITVMVAIIPLASLVHHRPADLDELVDGGQEGPRRLTAMHVTDVDFTAREAMRTKAFWLISCGHASALFVVSAVLAHRAIYLTDERGWSTLASGLVGGAVVLMQFVGQLIGGFLGDRIDKRYIAATAMAGHMTGLLMFAHAGTHWMVWAFVPLHGLAWGARGPLMQAMRADYFGARSFGTIMGFSSLVVMVGMMSGGLVAGAMADATGSYTPGFSLLALLSGTGAVFFLLLRPPPPPVRPVEAAASDANAGTTKRPPRSGHLTGTAASLASAAPERQGGSAGL
jgi:MFS family permease